MTTNLTPYGTAVNAAICSAGTITACQWLFTVKTFKMSGKGIPPLTSLYKGYEANIVSDMVNQVVAFVANRFFSNVIMDSKSLTSIENCLGGMFSGVMSGPFVSILERIMILTQVEEGKTSEKKIKGSVQILKDIWNQEGVYGFRRGMLVTASRESINYTCFFGLKKIFQKQADLWIEDKKTASFVSYPAAGIVAGAVTTPLDLIKTRMQKTLGSRETFFQTAKQLMYPNNTSALGKFKLTAIKNLFQGCSARAATLGATMTTFGFLTEKVPEFLPGFLIEKKDGRL